MNQSVAWFDPSIQSRRLGKIKPVGTEYFLIEYFSPEYSYMEGSANLA